MRTWSVPATAFLYFSQDCSYFSQLFLISHSGIPPFFFGVRALF